MQVTKKEAERIFSKLNVSVKKSTHHNSGWVIVDGKKTYLVHYSRGRGDMPGNVGVKFAKSFGLDIEEFKVLKRCTMTKEEYLGVVRGRIGG